MSIFDSIPLQAHPNLGYEGDDDGDGARVHNFFIESGWNFHHLRTQNIAELLNTHYHHLEDKAHEKEDEERKAKAKRKLILASLICSIFLFAEIIGGALSHSIGKNDFQLYSSTQV